MNPEAYGVVAAVTDVAHAAGDVPIDQETLVVAAGELRSPVRVQHHRIAVGSLPARHQHGAEYEMTVLDIGHRPPDDLVAVQIEHGAQV